jgi:hypothetical protein
LDMLIIDVLEPGLWNLWWECPIILVIAFPKTRALQLIGMRGPCRNSRTRKAFPSWMHEDNSLRVCEGCWTNPVLWFSITLRGSVQQFYPAAALVHRAFHLVSLFQLRLKMLHLLYRYVHASQCTQLKPPQQTVGRLMAVTARH